MMVTHREVSPNTQAANLTKSTTSLVLYSADLELCLSLSLSLREQFRLFTTADPEMLAIYTKALQPHLIIVDSFPTERLRWQCERLKRMVPQLHIVLLCMPSSENRRALTRSPWLIDTVLEKPIDLTTIVHCIDSLMINTMTAA